MVWKGRRARGTATAAARAIVFATGCWLLVLGGIALAQGSSADSTAAARASDPSGFHPQFKPTLEIAEAPGPIHVDGALDDAGWKGAARATGFAEVNPGDQIKPPVESEAWVTYDHENLYVALLARDDPSTVRVSLRERDNIFNDDYFGIMIDPYGDFQSCYELFVNPLGIQGDLRMTNGGDNEDDAYDAVWTSRGKITNEGYQVEIAIPFASLRFQDRPEQAWRINFWRDHQRETRRRYAWAAINRDDPCWMCNFGTMRGLRGIKPGSNVDFIASVVGSQAGARSDFDDPTSRFDNQDVEGEASVTARYGLSSTASAEIAINPDFSQIESDAGQIDVNEPFALFFPERRPFFQEGSDLYDTWITAIYTRSINNPEIAGKLTGRLGHSAFAYTLARDEDSPILIPQEERTDFAAGGRSISQFTRFRQNLGENNFLGGLVTDRRLEGDGGGAGTVLAADGGMQLLRNYRIEGQFALSHTEEAKDPALSEDFGDATFERGKHTVALDGEAYWGQAAYASLERDARVWNSDMDFYTFSPTFRTDNGFNGRNDYTQWNWWNGLTFNPNRRWLREWRPQFGFGRIWNYDGKVKDEWIRPHLSFTSNYQTDFYGEFRPAQQRFRDRQFNGVRTWYTEVNTRPASWLRGGFSVDGGRVIRRTFGSEPFLGRVHNASCYFTFKPTQRLGINPNYNWSRMETADGSSTVYDGYILRTHISYQFSRELSARVVTEYDKFDSRLSFEPLVTYRINAFTVFYLGSTGQYHRYLAEPVAGRGIGGSGEESAWMSARSAGGAEGSEPADDWEMTSRQFFAKIQYLVRL